MFLGLLVCGAAFRQPHGLQVVKPAYPAAAITATAQSWQESASAGLSNCARNSAKFSARVNVVCHELSIRPSTSVASRFHSIN